MNLPAAQESGPVGLPGWITELIALYESDAASQFVLHGNLQDRFALAANGRVSLVALPEFLQQVLLPRFDVVLSYDLGNGVRIERGSEFLTQWPGYKDHPELPRSPRPAIEWLTHYLRYCANLGRLGGQRLHVACIVKAANLVAPAAQAGGNTDVSALALLMRDWSSEALLSEHSIATFLLTENLSDLHPLLAANPRASRVKIPLPDSPSLTRALEAVSGRYPIALSAYSGQLDQLAAALQGISLNAVESLLKLKQYRAEPLRPDDLVRLKKELVESESQGLVEFIESDRTLDDLHGQERLKEWLRQDLALWQSGHTRAVPMGYLVCGPVGTGKTYLVECLAGEAGVPVVKIKNFRDRWVGSTEGNLEKIFRLLGSLSRCYVFIDEADQALGRRDAGSNDSGLSGRVYSMIAAEMSRRENRGRIVWVLASSRPDLIEVDLKRPGRVDVKIPIFPTVTEEESWALLRALCCRYGLAVEEIDPAAEGLAVPLMLTAGAAETLAAKLYREAHTSGRPLREVLRSTLAHYQPPIAPDVLQEQIDLAIAEASDRDFVPEAFRSSN